MISNSPANPLDFAGAVTASDAVTSILTIPAAQSFQNLILTNTGAGSGFISIDGGNSWHLFTGAVGGAPGGLYLNNISMSFPQGGLVKVRNAVAGTNLSGLFVTLA